MRSSSGTQLLRGYELQVLEVLTGPCGLASGELLWALSKPSSVMFVEQGMGLGVGRFKNNVERHFVVGRWGRG